MAADYIINESERVLITGANVFIGTRVVDTLLFYGYRNLVCLMRPSAQDSALLKVITGRGSPSIEICRGNLLSREVCDRVTEGVSVIYHLAAGRGVKSYPDAFLNSVVTTRNLLEAAAHRNALRRFVGVSSFSVYSNLRLKRGELLDETCEMEVEPELRGEAYCYAKVRQDELTADFCGKNGIPYVLVRPGVVFGPGNRGLPGRIGIDLLGIFLHMGGSNRIPFTYVDNCAEAIILAGLRRGVEGEVFNVVDDDLPTSREFLNLYKKNVRPFRSIRIPRTASYLLCSLWEKYSNWSRGQLPPVFNTRRWSNDWKGNSYSNKKIKTQLAWIPRVTFSEASHRFFNHERSM
jgi:nucleoside-diphosphate-sugar epimerase